jgi:hypothetical protein
MDVLSVSSKMAGAHGCRIPRGFLAPGVYQFSFPLPRGWVSALPWNGFMSQLAIERQSKISKNDVGRKPDGRRVTSEHAAFWMQPLPRRRMPAPDEPGPLGRVNDRLPNRNSGSSYDEE